jgi:hypothetical protein
MRIHPAGLVLSAVLAISVAHAQSIFVGTSVSSSGDTTTVTLRSPRPFAPSPITGAPFTADRVSEHTQTLGDGTHIRQPQNVEHISRDSQGRTRTERTLFQGMMGDPAMKDFRVTEISDPVGGFGYVLDDQNKIAHRVALEARPQRPTLAPAAGTVPVVVSTGGGTAGIEAGVVRRTPADDPNQPQHAMERLGSKNIEGVIAEGTRNTTTWPVNSQGNDRPMVSTNENWRSTELKESVLSTNNDPRSGENVTKLINVSRAEPDPSLFEPPSGYTVVDDKDAITMTFKRQQAQ